MKKQYVLFVFLVCLVFALNAGTTRTFIQKVVCPDPNNILDIVTNTGTTTNPDYTIQVWMTERPGEILSTASTPATNLRISKIGNGTSIPYYAGIYVNLGSFATQWAEGNHLHYRVIYNSTAEVSEFENIIPAGTASVIIQDPAQFVPPNPIVVDSYTYNLTINCSYGSYVSGPGFYSGEVPTTFTCGPNATDINDLVGTWYIELAPFGFHWQQSSIDVTADMFVLSRTDFVYNATIEFVLEPDPDTFNYTLNLLDPGSPESFYVTGPQSGYLPYTAYDNDGTQENSLLGTYTASAPPPGLRWVTNPIEVTADMFTQTRTNFEYAAEIGFVLEEDIIEPSITLISPTTNATGVSITPTFEWSYSDGNPPVPAGWFTFSMVNASDPSESYYYDGMIDNVWPPFTPNLSLDLNTTYNWTVTANGGYPSSSGSFTTLVPDATINGLVSMSYNGSPVQAATVKVMINGNTFSSCQTQADGSYSLPVMLNTPLSLVVEAQTVLADGDYISVNPYSVDLTLTESFSQNIALDVCIPVLNTENCTSIGTYLGHEYWLSNWADYWEYMVNDFSNRGGHMITINSEGESQFITNYILQNGGEYHLGLYYYSIDIGSGIWKWVDGSELTYTNWNPGEPNGDSEVTFLTNTGTWVDVWYWNRVYSSFMESNGIQRPFIPKQVTSFSVQQQRDFTINLSWTNPSEVLCGLNLSNGFDIIIKRNGVIVTVLTNCSSGAVMNWQDFSLTGGLTYEISVENQYGSSQAVQSVFYGNQVQGVARLNNVADHSGIKVLFIADPSTPAAVSDSTYTNINGFYSINLTIGRYDIVYSKTNYLDITYFNYEHSQPIVLPEQSLEFVGPIMHISGSLSGILTSEYAYIIDDQIAVEEGYSLVLNPGVKFYFKNGVGFNVNGVLTAIGTSQNPIVFTSIGNEVRGDMWINNSNSQLIYCEFTKATIGLRINSNAYVAHSYFHHNVIGVRFDNADSNCLFEYNEISDCSETVFYLKCWGARIEHNEIHNNNQLTGQLFYMPSGRQYWWEYQQYGAKRHSAELRYNYFNNNSSLNILLLHSVDNDLIFEYNVVEYNTTPSWLFYIVGYEMTDNPWGSSTTYFCSNVIRNNNCGELLMFSCGTGEILYNTISYNTGNIRMGWWTYNVKGNIIANNSGNGLMVYNNSNIVGNTITFNSGNGIMVWDTAHVLNNLVTFNGGYELSCYITSPNINYNLFYDLGDSLIDNSSSLPFLLDIQTLNSNGTPCDTYWNISTDPLLYDVTNNNFNLLPTSPCINAGDPASPLDPDGTIADLGAYYYDMNASTHAQIAIPLSLYNFQSIAVGDTLIWNCQVRNTGTDPLVISSIQLNNPAFFLATQTRTVIPFSLTIAPSQTGYIPIGFIPAAVADYADTLWINSNALMNPQVSIRIFGAGTTSSSITLAMPQNNVVNVLSDLQLPLTVSDTTPYNLLSYNMSLSYDPAIFEFISLETVGTLCADWFTAVNSVSPGVLHIGASGIDPLLGAGDLFKLNFHTLSGILDGTESFININQVTFNEGGISLQGCFAAVTIRNIIYGDVDDNLAIQAYDAALTLQYSVMMDPLPAVDPRPWLDWRKLRADVSGDGNIFAYDASLILQRVVGLITVFPVEQTRPEPPLATVDISFYNNQLIVSSPDFSSLYGLNLSALLPEGLSLGQPQLSEAFSEAVWNQYTDYGVWNFALACIIPQTGSGTICTIPVSANANTELSFSIVANETESQQSVSILPLAVPDPPEIAVNFLAPNSPNPFNPSTVISYGVKEPARVELGIYNLKGQKVKSLVNAEQSSGAYRVVWNGNDDHDSPVGSGIYFCRIKIGNSWSKTQKMMLMK